MYSQNMMNMEIALHGTYRSLADVVIAKTLLMTTLEKTVSPDLDERRPVMKSLSSRAERFSKT
jgi:hypothetical protein